jgi:anti-sigma regulatory factor (Ser/Thr protein kinase)
LHPQLRFDIQEGSQVFEARRATGEVAQRLGFSDVEIGEVALAVTEAATNLVKHAQQGQLLVRALEHGSIAGLELLALDSGPGIQNVSQSLHDGFSTAGSPGTGLGALTRIADQFDIYSLPGKGTVLRLAMWRGKALPTPEVEIGAVCQPKSGEEVSGDDWGLATRPRKYTLTLADGLGHGPDAHKAARVAIDTLYRFPNVSPATLLENIHAAARPTRGAAVAVCELDQEQRVCRFAGVGNIGCTVIVDTVARHMVSHNGTVGHSVRKIQEFAAPWPQNAILVMHSDGVSTQWDLEAYPGLSARHPSLIAAVLYRDFSRHRDDATVVVATQRRAKS